MAKRKKKNRKYESVPQLKKAEVFSVMYDKLIEIPIIKLNRYIKNGDTRQSIIDDIVYDFDSELFKPIFVGELPNGELWIYDGTHRTVAADTLKMKVIKGYIRKVSSMAEIAALYKKHNTSTRRKNQFEIWLAGVEAGESPYVEIQDIFDTYGITYGGGTRDNNVSTLAEVKLAYEAYGLETIRMAFQFIREATQGHKASLRKEGIIGITFFLYWAQQDPNFNFRGFIQKFKKKKFDPFYSKFPTSKRPIQNHAATEFTAIHNNNVDDSKKLCLNISVK